VADETWDWRRIQQQFLAAERPHRVDFDHEGLPGQWPRLPQALPLQDESPALVAPKRSRGPSFTLPPPSQPMPGSGGGGRREGLPFGHAAGGADGGVEGGVGVAEAVGAGGFERAIEFAQDQPFVS